MNTTDDQFDQGWLDAEDILNNIPEKANEQFDYWAGYGIGLTRHLAPEFLRPAWTRPMFSLKLWLSRR